MTHINTTVCTRDALRLVGTLAEPSDSTDRAVALVHGGGVTREEGGFFTRLAEGLATSGITSLRFDLRGHGDSEGKQEELTLSGILADIDAALDVLRERTGVSRPALLGASFSGGICGYYTTQYPNTIASLVLFNPLLNYKKRLIDDKPYWHNNRLDEQAGRELAAMGYLAHSPSFKLGRPLLNELFYLRPDRSLHQITTPILFVHGTKDTFIPVESSREAVTRLPGEAALIEIDGAQHGFAVHDDPTYAQPQTQQWQASVIQSVIDWIRTH
jgi:pimeloyl-ACP methyl ester carboxylesterase